MTKANRLSGGIKQGKAAKELHIFIEGKHQVELSKGNSIAHSREPSLVKNPLQIVETPYS